MGLFTELTAREAPTIAEVAWAARLIARASTREPIIRNEEQKILDNGIARRTIQGIMPINQSFLGTQVRICSN